MIGTIITKNLDQFIYHESYCRKYSSTLDQLNCPRKERENLKGLHTTNKVRNRGDYIMFTKIERSEVYDKS